MSDSKLTVVGSVAIDHIITPRAVREESVGGSATFFSMAASYFAPIQLVGVVGGDFPDGAVADLKRRKVDVDGLEVLPEGLTFRWKGRYHENMNDRDTLETHLNCFEHFQPKLPASYRNSDHLFLANIQPGLQMQVLEQMETRPRVVGLDTMNLWIDIAVDELKKVLAKVDVLLINEEEARQLAAVDNLVDAARFIRGLGPQTLIIKRGEYGALMFGPHDEEIFSAPALPLQTVADPTGAGDCFAGGFMGHLARSPQIDVPALRGAMIWGSVMASYCVEGFSYDALSSLEDSAIKSRYDRFVRLADFPR